VPPRERACACGGNRIVWLARYVDPDGHEKAQTFGRQQDAEDFIEGIEASKNTGDYVDPKAGRETLDSIYGRFVKQAKLSPTTWAKWEGIWTRYVKPRLGSTKVSSITKNAVIETMNAPESPWQGNEALKLVKRLLYFAVDDGILTRNVAARIKPREVERQKIEILEPAELTAVLDHLGDRWRAMVLLDAMGSLRWSELIGLRRQDLDLEARTVTITQKVTEVDGVFPCRPAEDAGERADRRPPGDRRQAARGVPPAPSPIARRPHLPRRERQPRPPEGVQSGLVQGARGRRDREACPAGVAQTFGREPRLRGDPRPEARQ
jgi:integrase